jgi:hypothetical protein
MNSQNMSKHVESKTEIGVVPRHRYAPKVVVTLAYRTTNSLL